jgi:DNA-binding beta-propeller fold protein YncE
VLDVTSGRVLHTRGIELFPQGVTLDARRGRVFVSSPGSDCVSVLETRHGLLLRTTHVGTNPTTPIVDEQTGRVFVASAAAATVSVLAAGTGRLLRTVALGPAAGTARVGLGQWAGPDSMQHIVAAGAEPGLVALAERSGRVLVATSSTTAQAVGSVSVLDAHSGAVLRTIPVSGDPVAVAVDERVRRALIVAGAGVLPLGTQWSPWAQWAHALQRWLPQQVLRALPGVPPQVAAYMVPASVTVLDTSRV